jgi:cobalt-zinc-cadmium efflux system protein
MGHRRKPSFFEMASTSEPWLIGPGTSRCSATRTLPRTGNADSASVKPCRTPGPRRWKHLSGPRARLIDRRSGRHVRAAARPRRTTSAGSVTGQPSDSGPRPPASQGVAAGKLSIAWDVTRTGRLRVVLVLNLLLVSGLVVVGLSSHSLGVLAEGVDYLADTAAIAVSLLAIWLSNRPSSAKHPNGYPKATTLAAALNAGWLLVLSLLVVAGATDRLVTGTHQVHGLPVLIVSGIAAAVMVGGALILDGDFDDLDDEDDGNLNMRAVLLDTAADAATAAGVAAAGGLILATGSLFWLDPAVALVIALVVGYHAVRLLGVIITALRAPSLGSLGASP